MSSQPVATKPDPAAAGGFGVKHAYPYIKTPRRLRWVRWAVWWAIFVVVTVVACWLLARYYSQARARQAQKSAVLGDGTGDFLVQFQPTKFDSTAGTLTVTYSVIDVANAADPKGRIGNATTFSTGGATPAKTFAAGSVLGPFQATYTLTADPSTYPFDQYAVDVVLFAVRGGTGDPATLDVVFNLDTALASFQYEDVVFQQLSEASSSAGAIAFTFAFRRSTVTIALTVFTWILMHLWTVMVVFLAGQCIFRERPAYPFMVWAAASIFTMGTIRGIQPSAPVVGTYYDMGTYVWAVVMSCAAAFALFVVSFRKHKPASEKEKMLEKKGKEAKIRKIIREETALASKLS